MEQRRTQRYKLQLPVQILQMGEEHVNRVEQTRDISSGGVCFVSSTAVEPGCRMEYVITLAGSNPPVRIRCLGKVLRTHTVDTGRAWEVAVSMERYSFVRPEETEPVSIPA